MELDRALVIGATSRNCGKTTFICSVLTRFRELEPIAIKVKTVYPDDAQWHGTGRDFNGEYELREETTGGELVDSSRLLESGAIRVFYLKSLVESLEEGILNLLSLIPAGNPLIFESNSLLYTVNPAVFLMIQGTDIKKYKPSAIHFLDQADLIIGTNGESHKPSPFDLPLRWVNGKWILN